MKEKVEEEMRERLKKEEMNDEVALHLQLAHHERNNRAVNESLSVPKLNVAQPRHSGIVPIVEHGE